MSNNSTFFAWFHLKHQQNLVKFVFFVHRVLRAKNELKKDVNASYNRDSSVDYDDDENLK